MPVLPMTNKPEITQENFEKLLTWLDKDRNRAAEKYKSIHQRLVQIFLARNAFSAEELADQTVDIVVKKIDSLSTEYQGDPALYFYGVANKIFYEYLKKPKTESLNEQTLQVENKEDEDNSYRQCMRKCLNNLLPEQREFVIEYFRYKKQAKINHHKEMAKRMNLDVNAMRTRVYRLKLDLERCVRKCVSKDSL